MQRFTVKKLNLAQVKEEYNLKSAKGFETLEAKMITRI